MKALFKVFPKPIPESLLRHRRRVSPGGFTRLELMVVLGSVFLLLSLALPALANKARFAQLGCFNNLRQIGRAFHLWANDHDNVLPMYVPAAQGGTALALPATQGTTTWFQFGVLSNELGNARVLACPSDNKRPSEDFSFDPDRGLFHANFRNSSVSYFLAHPYLREARGVLSGDRNVQADQTSSCSVYGTTTSYISPQPTVRERWTTSMHVRMGHILHVDGQVELVDNAGLWPALKYHLDEDTAFHYLVP